MWMRRTGQGEREREMERGNRTKRERRGEREKEESEERCRPERVDVCLGRRKRRVWGCSGLCIFGKLGDTRLLKREKRLGRGLVSL